MDNILGDKPALEVKIEKFIEKPSEENAKEAYDKILAFEHMEAVKKLGSSEKVYSELKEIDMPEEVRVKLVDIMPRNKDIIKMIFYQFTYTSQDSVVDAVNEIIQKHLPKKAKKKGGK